MQIIPVYCLVLDLFITKTISFVSYNYMKLINRLESEREGGIVQTHQLGVVGNYSIY